MELQKEKCHIKAFESNSSINSELIVESLRKEIEELKEHQFDLEYKLIEMSKICDEKISQITFLQRKYDENSKIILNQEKEIQELCKSQNEASQTYSNKIVLLIEKIKILNLIKDNPSSHLLEQLISFPKDGTIKFGSLLFEVFLRDESLICNYNKLKQGNMKNLSMRLLINFYCLNLLSSIKYEIKHCIHLLNKNLNLLKLVSSCLKL